jgi:hypothetical protein
MYFTTAAIASLVVAITASTPTDISLPMYEKADSHHFQATVALSLDKDVGGVDRRTACHHLTSHNPLQQRVAERFK